MTRRPLRAHHHAGYLLLRSILAIGGAMPLPALRSFGRTAGWTALRLSHRDRRRAEDQLRIAFPDLAESELKRLLKASARHLGLVLAEVAWLWHASPEAVRGLVTIEGVEHLETARSDGGGAVLVTGHIGNWELLNARLGAAGIPMTIAVRGLFDPRLDGLATRLRSRHGAEVVPRGDDAGRRLIAALHRNRVDGLLIDQDIAGIPGVFVPFFGRDAWTPSGAAAIALRARRPVVPAFIHRDRSHRHHVTVHPPLPVAAGTDLRDRVRELTAAATAAIEAQIRRHPEQWVWMHRRWRTRPAEGDQ